ncbi:amidase family protein [Xenorhabdus sp. IM139775]|uniref:amidase family protein n=1 Tax=Xenorhabdus sp. IM139775 TaxID=3025876 RepID=UPI0023597000|nr:amidase family protein [Xenorhabdus sp. IM139775]MDC9595026.1 amidase family protein [Xenorhabdus sp. IM139775]
MEIKHRCSLANEVAQNHNPSGLAENNAYHLGQYHKTRNDNYFISFDESLLSTESYKEKTYKQPLSGLPFSCKDNINARGFATTAGTRGLDDFIPEDDAPIIAKLKDLGAVLCGKNNMHELSFGVTSRNGHWGNVENPVHPGRIVGGSSGGSAASVAAGVSAFAVGTDTGGSVRIPASLCGLAGFRPTKGRYPREGIVPVSDTKDTPGFIAPTVEDIAFLDAALMNESPIKSEKPRRIGVPSEFMWEGLDNKVSEACNRAVNKLRNAGIEIIQFDDRKLGHLNVSVQFPIPFYDFFIDFPRFLLKHKIKRSFDSIINQLTDQKVNQILKNQLQKNSVSWDDYMAGITALGKLRAVWYELFDVHNLDLIIYPTVSCDVPLIEDAEEPAIFEKLVRNTDIASSVGAPSLTLPIGLQGELSVGLSVDGLPNTDRQLLSQSMDIAAILHH